MCSDQGQNTVLRGVSGQEAGRRVRHRPPWPGLPADHLQEATRAPSSLDPCLREQANIRRADQLGQRRFPPRLQRRRPSLVAARGSRRRLADSAGAGAVERSTPRPAPWWYVHTSPACAPRATTRVPVSRWRPRRTWRDTQQQRHRARPPLPERAACPQHLGRPAHERHAGAGAGHDLQRHEGTRSIERLHQELRRDDRPPSDDVGGRRHRRARAVVPWQAATRPSKAALLDFRQRVHPYRSIHRPFSVCDASAAARQQPLSAPDYSVPPSRPAPFMRGETAQSRLRTAQRGGRPASASRSPSHSTTSSMADAVQAGKKTAGARAAEGWRSITFLRACVGKPQDQGASTRPKTDEKDVDEYCSRVCCYPPRSRPVSEFQEESPRMDTYGFYQDVRSYDRGREECCQRAAGAGTLSVRWNDQEPQTVTKAEPRDGAAALVQARGGLTSGEESKPRST